MSDAPATMLAAVAASLTKLRDSRPHPGADMYHEGEPCCDPRAFTDTVWSVAQRAAKMQALAEFLERHADELVECSHGKLAGKCNICDNDE